MADLKRWGFDNKTTKFCESNYPSIKNYCAKQCHIAGAQLHSSCLPFFSSNIHNNNNSTPKIFVNSEEFIGWYFKRQYKTIRERRGNQDWSIKNSKNLEKTYAKCKW